MRSISSVFVILFVCGYARSQSNNQTSSPYSLFGLGRLNEAAPGRTNAMGESGIALSAGTEINNLNPAAYASIPEKHFFFDLGGKGETNTYSNADDSQKTTTFSFSNIALAFALSAKDGIGVTLLPYSDVGYNLTGITGDIEGSDDTFSSDVAGSGGLSNFTVNYGRKIGKNFNVGIGFNYLFGKISESEVALIDGDYLVVNTKNYYKGMRFTAGMQYHLGNKITAALTVKLPASVKGTKDIDAYTIIGSVQTNLDISVGNRLDAFRLPAEVTVGGLYKFNSSLSVIADYRRSFWTAQHMQDNIGEFVDQDFLGLGVEYSRNKSEHRYIDKVKLRAGLNLDNGYLEVNDRRISNYKAVFGIGLPVPSRMGSTISLSYGFGRRGAVSETLVREDFQTFSINLNLQDLWFIQKKYD